MLPRRRSVFFLPNWNIDQYSVNQYFFHTIPYFSHFFHKAPVNPRFAGAFSYISVDKPVDNVEKSASSFLSFAKPKLSYVNNISVALISFFLPYK